MITEIHTHIYSDDFNAVLNILYRYMLISHCGRTQVKNARNVKIIHESDGESHINVKYPGSNTIYLNAFDEDKFFNWLAKMFKRYAVTCNSSYKDRWKRNNFKDIVFDKNSISNSVYNRDINLSNDVYIGDIYCIYDILRKTEKIDKKYPEDVLNRWRGVQRDPLEAEAIRLCNEEIEKINFRYSILINDCNFYGYKSNHNSLTKTSAAEEMHKLYMKLEDEKNLLYSELIKKFNEKVKQLEETVGKKWKDEAKRLEQRRQEKIKALKNSLNIF